MTSALPLDLAALDDASVAKAVTGLHVGADELPDLWASVGALDFDRRRRIRWPKGLAKDVAEVLTSGPFADAPELDRLIARHLAGLLESSGAAAVVEWADALPGPLWARVAAALRAMHGAAADEARLALWTVPADLASASGAELAAQVGAWLSGSRALAQRLVCRLNWTPHIAREFVDALEPGELVEVTELVEEGLEPVAGALPRNDTLAVLEDALVEGPSTHDPAVVLERIAAGSEPSARDLAGVPDAELARCVAGLCGGVDQFRRLVAVLSRIPRERALTVAPSGIAREVAGIIHDPTFATPLLDERVRAAFLEDLSPTYTEERPNPVSYAASRLHRVPAPLRPHAVKVLRALASDADGGGGAFEGRSAASWATETLDTLVSRGEIAG